MFTYCLWMANFAKKDILQKLKSIQWSIILVRYNKIIQKYYYLIKEGAYLFGEFGKKIKEWEKLKIFILIQGNISRKNNFQIRLKIDFNSWDWVRNLVTDFTWINLIFHSRESLCRNRFKTHVNRTSTKFQIQHHNENGRYSIYFEFYRW